MKIFWSWQSDTPKKTGRFLIRAALDDAINRLKVAPDIEEPVRKALHVDQDIQGVSGSPDLAQTILRKIDASEVVVADVTLVGEVGQTDVDKKLINSNVAIELGYALHALSDRNVVLVFNQHYGKHEDLPFDLRHKGGAIVFNVPPDADSESIVVARKNLADQFVNKLKPYIQKAVLPSAPFTGSPSTFSKAAYFQKGEALASSGESGSSEVTYSYGTESLCYVRLVPATALSDPIRLPKLNDAVHLVPLLTRDFDFLSGLNNYGAIRIMPESHPSSGRAPIAASTQLFETGEIWSVGASLVRTKSLDLSKDTPPYIHSVEFEEVFYNTLRSIVKFAATHLLLNPPWQVEFGIVGATGVRLWVVWPGARHREHLIQKADIVHGAILKDAQAITLDPVLLEFFSKVHDATGTARRDGYCGFPPNRPDSA